MAVFWLLGSLRWRSYTSYNRLTVPPSIIHEQQIVYRLWHGTTQHKIRSSSLGIEHCNQDRKKLEFCGCGMASKSELVKARTPWCTRTSALIILWKPIRIFFVRLYWVKQKFFFFFLMSFHLLCGLKGEICSKKKCQAFWSKWAVNSVFRKSEFHVTIIARRITEATNELMG